MALDKVLLNQVSRWVSACFQNIPCRRCIFHNYNHTKETVAAGGEIAAGMLVSTDQLETILLACWFHDLGILHSPENHEEKSAKAAEDFLNQQPVSKEKIQQVKTCILATKIPQKPVTLLEKIVCDADISHLGKENYFEKNTLLRQEFELQRKKPYSDLEWWILNKDFFHQHQYFTSFARQRYDAQKQLNLSHINKLVTKARGKTPGF